MDIFPKNLSTTVWAIWYLDRPIPQQVKAFVTFQEFDHHRIFHRTFRNEWMKNPKRVDNFKRTFQDSKICNYFNPRLIKWEKVSKRLGTEPNRELQNTAMRLGYLLNENHFLVNKFFSFGHWLVPKGQKHVYQTTDAPIVCYVLPPSHSQALLVRRSFLHHDQLLYEMYVFRPDAVYVVPENTRYLILTVQKTRFAVDVVSKDFDVGNVFPCTAHRTFEQEDYDLPPPTPVHTVQWEPVMPPSVMPFDPPTRKLTSLESQLDPMCSPTDSQDSFPLTQELNPITAIIYMDEQTDPLNHFNVVDFLRNFEFPVLENLPGETTTMDLTTPGSDENTPMDLTTPGSDENTPIDLTTPGSDENTPMDTDTALDLTMHKYTGPVVKKLAYVPKSTSWMNVINKCVF